MAKESDSPQQLKMFCHQCGKMTGVLAVYDCIETWTLVRDDFMDGTTGLGLGEMIEGSEIVGVRDFKCAQCHEYVMEDGEYVLTEYGLVDIINQQFMD